MNNSPWVGYYSGGMCIFLAPCLSRLYITHPTKEAFQTWIISDKTIICLENGNNENVENNNSW